MPDAIGDQLHHLRTYLGGFLSGFVAFAGGIIVVIAIIFLTMWVGARVRGWVVERSSRRLSRIATAAPLIDNLFRLGIFVLGIFLALGVVGASPGSLVTWFGVIVAALSLAVQDVIKNLVAGFYLLIEQPFQIGDWLNVGGESGTVERVDLRITVLRNNRRELVFVPNYIVFSQVVRNRVTQRAHCLEVTISPIVEPPETIASSVTLAVRSVLGDAGERPEIELTSIRPGGVTATVRAWMTNPEADRDRLLIAIYRRFPESQVQVING